MLWKKKKVEMKTRLEYLDVAKGIGILCVVIGHSFVPMALNNWIYSFHMPLFFIISGYFCSKREFSEVISKGWKQLLLPVFVTTIVANIGLSILFSRSGEWLGPNVIEYIFNIIMFKCDFDVVGLWFVWALFWGKIWFCFLQEMPKYWIFIVSVLLFFLGCMLYPTLRGIVPWHIDKSLQVPIFLFVGMVLNQYNVFDSFCDKTALFVSLVIVLLAWMFPINMVFYVYPHGIFSAFLSMIIATALLVVLKYLCDNIDLKIRVLQFAGQNSLLILCMHGTLCYWQVHKFFSTMPICTYAIVQCIFLLIAAFFLLKIPVVNKLFHGKIVK